MTVLQSILAEEIERLEEYLKLLISKLALIPRLQIRTNKSGKRYVYEVSKSPGTKYPATTYLGPIESPQARKALAILEKRKPLKEDIKKAKANLKAARKSLYGRSY